MALIKCHECGHDVSTEAAACPNCGAPVRGATSKSAELTPSQDGAKNGRLILGIVLVIALVLILLKCSNSTSQSSVSAPAQQNQIEPATGQTGAPPEPQAPPIRPRTFASLQEAVDGLKPLMTDELNTLSPGATALAVWSSKNLKWADLKSLKSTNGARVMKDSDEERGKLICTFGRIIEVAVEKADGYRYNVGGMSDDAGRIYRFVTVGSSGELVEGSHTGICGVAIGRFDYTNSMNGVAHAVQLVGMFDLPENRRTKGQEKEIEESPEEAPSPVASEPQT